MSRAPGSRRGATALKVLLAVVAALVLIAGGTLVWAEHQINPGRAGAAVSVRIPSGASVTDIGHILSRAGVVHDAALFALYVRLHGDGPLYPGSYSLARNSSYQAAITALKRGPKIATDKLVVPEGFTVRQIGQALAALPDLHLSADKFVAAATDGSVSSPYEPPGVHNLEGLLFPDTYFVRQGESEVDVLERMVGLFDQKALSLGLPAAASTLGVTTYQLVTVASIVEKEAKLEADRGPTASVIYNRLRDGMSLGADSTQTYYLRLSDPSVVPTAAQLDVPSPYNTRTHKGLPPTPIASPGVPSLEAAASPPQTSYLYFVQVNPDGQLGFASNASGFAGLQARCRAAKLC